MCTGGPDLPREARELCHKIAAGDQAAGHDLWSRVEGPLSGIVRRAYSRLGTHDTEAVVGDAFASLCLRLVEGQIIEEPWDYLVTACLNRAASFWAARQAHHPLPNDPDAEDAHYPIADERQSSMVEALDQLTAWLWTRGIRSLDILVLRARGLDSEEIGRQLQRSSRSVARHLEALWRSARDFLLARREK